MINLLSGLGLSEKEAKVYFAALQLGDAPAHDIAASAGLNRATTYVLLEQLSQVGLIQYVESEHIRQFHAADPVMLYDYLAQKQENLSAQTALLDQNLACLKAIYKTKNDKPVVRYFEGKEGMEALERYQENLLAEDFPETWSMIPIDLIEEQFPTTRKEALRERIRRGIRSHVLYTHQHGPIPQSIHHEELRDAVFLPREKFDINETIRIYPNWGIKVFNFDPDNYFGILIQSQSFARNMLYLMQLAQGHAQVSAQTQKSGTIKK